MLISNLKVIFQDISGLIFDKSNDHSNTVEVHSENLEAKNERRQENTVIELPKPKMSIISERQAKNTFKCPKCHLFLKTKISLKRHLEKKICKFSCRVCGKNFARCDSLRKHELIHDSNSIQNFPCEIPDCGKTFKLKQQLQNHGKTHSNVTYFHCAICSIGFKEKHSYQRHLDTNKHKKALKGVQKNKK